MKRKIADFLVWALHKLAKNHIEITKQYLGTEELTVGFGKWVPRDEKWHYVSCLFGVWMFLGKKGVEKKDRTSNLMVDGATVTENPPYRFENGQCLCGEMAGENHVCRPMCVHKMRDEIGGDCEVCEEIVKVGGEQYKRGYEDGLCDGSHGNETCRCQRRPK